MKPRLLTIPWIVMMAAIIVAVSSWTSPFRETRASASGGAGAEAMDTTPVPQSLQQAPDSCWPYHQYFPQVAVPYPATPTPVATGDVRWSRTVHVVVAHTTPAAPITGAMVEARDLTYDCCITGAEGGCGVSIWAHDTHYVGVRASATGYEPGGTSVPAILWYDPIIIPLEPKGD